MVKTTIVDVVVDDVEKRRIPSKHYVYVICVTWNDGSINVIYRRYSRFFELQSKLLDKFQEDAGTHDPSRRIIPFLPGKILFGRSHIREVALKRLQPINQYCKTLMNLPAHISECEEVIMFFETSADDLLHHSKDEEPRSSRKSKGNQISHPLLLDQYMSLGDYTKQGRTELNLYSGRRVEVVEKTEIGWWFVTTEEGQGWVPSSYLEKDDGSLEDRVVHQADPGEEEMFVITDTYVPTAPDEIMIDKGGFVQVFERNLDGWWLVRYKGREGRVPATNLTRADTMRANRVSSLAGPATPVEVVPNLMAISNIHLQNFDQSTPEAPSSSNQDAAHRTANQKPLSANSASSVKLKENLASRLGDEKGDPPVSIRGSRRKLPPPRRNSISQDRPSKKVAPPRPSPPEMEPVYVALSDFQVNVDEGVSLQEGQVVSVLEKTETGWWYVSVGTSRGWTPVSHITKRNKPVKKSLPKPPRPPVPPCKPSTSTASSTPDDSHVSQGVASSAAKLAAILKNPHDKHPKNRQSPPGGNMREPVERAATCNPPTALKPPVTSKPTSFSAPAPSAPSPPPVPPQKTKSVDAGSTGTRDERPQLYANVDDDDIELKQYIAAYDYEGRELGEVILTEGDCVEVVGCNPSGWWYVKILSGQGRGDGWVPSSYLRPAADYSPEDDAISSIYAEVPDDDLYQDARSVKDDAFTETPLPLPQRSNSKDDTPRSSRSASTDDDPLTSATQSASSLTSPQDLKRLDDYIKSTQKARPPLLPKKKSLDSTFPQQEAAPTLSGGSQVLNLQRALLNGMAPKSLTPPPTPPDPTASVPMVTPKPAVPNSKPAPLKQKPVVPTSKPSQVPLASAVSSSRPQVVAPKPAVPIKKPSVSMKPGIALTKPQIADKKPPPMSVKPQFSLKSIERKSHNITPKPVSITGNRASVTNSKPQINNGFPSNKNISSTVTTRPGVSTKPVWTRTQSSVSPRQPDTHRSYNSQTHKKREPSKVQDMAKLFSQS